ncbi:hypothetical protein D9M72_567820 [compost metagenome]
MDARVVSRVPSIQREMIRSTKVFDACTVAFTSASTKRLFWKSITGLPNTLRSLVYSTVRRRARSITATAPTPICARSNASWRIRV